MDPQYVCWAPEVSPSTGKEHWQCYAYSLVTSSHQGTEKPQKRKDGTDKAKNLNAQERRTIPAQGKRTDLVDFVRGIRAQKRLHNLDDFLPLRAEYPNFEKTIWAEELEIRAKNMYQEGRKPKVHVRL